MIAVGLLVALWPKRASQRADSQPREILRSELMLQEGRLYQPGQSNAFTGLMIERYANGTLKSRSAVSNGWLHGLSEGWHTNRQLQVTEHFQRGVSHGQRTKWYQSGSKLSEAQIADGQFEGPFRRWHENGVLADQVEFAQGQPVGVSLAYFPSGFLKARARLEAGKVLEQKYWRDGEADERLLARE